MATPLPKQTVENDIRIAGTPYEQLTQRQKDYAAKYNVGLMPPSGVSVSPGGAITVPGQVYDGTPVQSGPQIIPNPDPTGNPLVNGPDGATHSPAPGYTPGAPAPGTDAPSEKPSPEAEAAAAAAKAEQERRERERRNAYAMLQETLRDYGLDGLADQVWQWVQQDLSEAEILREMRKTEQFRKRFPAIEERVRKGLPALSPGEYVAYERQARQTFRAAGLPEGFYDSNDDFTKFLNNDVSLSELTDRVTMASSVAFRSDSQVLTALKQYGLTGGDLTAFFLDPDVAQPLLERKYNSARLSAAGSRAGFGFLDETEAVGLVQAGVSEGAAAEGFGDLVQQRELFGSLDAGEDDITRSEQLGGTFTGNGNARRRIQQRARRRQSQFEGGGSFAAGQEGVFGLGNAPS